MTTPGPTLPKLIPGAEHARRTVPAAAAVPKRGKPRLRALDGLRLVAALMVAAYHYGGRDGEIAEAWGSSPKAQFPTASEWFAYGCLGVQIFFVISGFVICMSGWGRPMRSFFASRASRLLPSYWAAIVLVTAVFALPAVTYAAVSPSDALVNLTMLQQPLGADRVLGVCWTLWAELRFYALFALCVVMPGATRARVVLFCAVWTLAAAMSEAANEPLLDLVLMPEYAPFFVGGIGIYLIHRDRRDLTAWGITGVSWLIGQHYAVDRLWHAPNPDFFSYRSSVGIMAVVTAGFLAVLLIALGHLDRANWRWLTVAGALTYPFYLVHEHLGWVTVEALHRHVGLPSHATFGLTIVAMLALAWLLNRYVEERLTPLIRNGLNRSLTPGPSK
ncbi:MULTISPECIES: acyltransferase [Streptomyces]|uniref:Acyltransferase n=1 Tax=Streptomyces venezuelae TaxID=54571 RepID=A0A5P2BKY1_STRVZ|nr:MULTISPECIES: acyltransferase [Streptomyces]NEA03011.1 acyltransferase [Streptomyces sp. SID10116]MYY84488.1 acyltransferase family protein [Streptomyces sp. SID335]MYZ15380.1 acyltransferase family protein [Streptomyces sp. SID337]NDZ91204.1 acyltransferase [Streptomyces sp. SID10115]NEB50324.1 acyltransferase [Streptomyces sp. SID339]